MKVSHCVLLLVLFVTLTSDKASSQVDDTGVTRSKEQVQQEIRIAINSPIAMYRALRIAGNTHNRYWSTALHLLEAECQKNPKNAVVRAGYVLCFNWRLRYPEKGFYPWRQPSTDYNKRNKLLAEAKQLSPGLWLTYIAESEGSGKESSVPALQEAVKLAPALSITHYHLGNAYTVAGRNLKTPALLAKEEPGQVFATNATEASKYYALAEKEFLKATQLPPVVPGVWFSLCYHYLVYVPDKEKARNAWQSYLRTLPLGDRQSLSPSEQLYPRIFKSKFHEDI